VIKEGFIQAYSETIKAREQHIEKLLDDIKYVRYLKNKAFVI
jgi:hypothetical protein